MLRAFGVTVVAALYTFLVGGPFLLHALFAKSTDRLYRVGVAGAKLILRLAGVNLETQGMEHIQAPGPLVFMPNHQSNADPPALFSILPPVLVMAKKEFFRLPILGQGMRLRGFIPIDRQNRQRAFAAIEAGVRALQSGHSFLVFPEGTRSAEGRLQPFKKGVFIMAIRAQAAIVPVSVSGGAKIMPKGTMRLRPGTIRITFHPPIPTQGLCEERDVTRLQEAVRHAILQGLAADEQPVAAAG